MADVHLRATLPPLFPGLPRRLDLDATTVADVIERLDRRWPGLRDRLCEPAPVLRPHTTCSSIASGRRSTPARRGLAPRCDRRDQRRLIYLSAGHDDRCRRPHGSPAGARARALAAHGRRDDRGVRGLRGARPPRAGGARAPRAHRVGQRPDGGAARAARAAVRALGRGRPRSRGAGRAGHAPAGRGERRDRHPDGGYAAWCRGGRAGRRAARARRQQLGRPRGPRPLQRRRQAVSRVRRVDAAVRAARAAHGPDDRPRGTARARARGGAHERLRDDRRRARDGARRGRGPDPRGGRLGRRRALVRRPERTARPEPAPDRRAPGHRAGAHVSTRLGYEGELEDLLDPLPSSRG
jgi:sulfur-carrier protein